MRPGAGSAALALVAVGLALAAAPAESQSVPGGDPHPPIRIVGDAAFADPRSGVRSGSGSPEDPYVISGWNITGVQEYVDDLGPTPPLAGQQAGIQVLDTTRSFVIRDVHVVQDRVVSAGGLAGEPVLQHGIQVARAQGVVGIEATVLTGGTADRPQVQLEDIQTLRIDDLVARDLLALRVAEVTLISSQLDGVAVHGAVQARLQGLDVAGPVYVNASTASLLESRANGTVDLVGTEVTARDVLVTGAGMRLQAQDGHGLASAERLVVSGAPDTALLVHAREARLESLELSCPGQGMGASIQTDVVRVTEAFVSGCADPWAMFGGIASVQDLSVADSACGFRAQQMVALSLRGYAMDAEPTASSCAAFAADAEQAVVEGLAVACRRSPCVTGQGEAFTLRHSTVVQVVADPTRPDVAVQLRGGTIVVEDASFVGGDVALLVEAEVQATVQRLASSNTGLGVSVDAPDFDVQLIEVTQALAGVAMHTRPGGTGAVRGVDVSGVVHAGLSVARGLDERPPAQVRLEGNRVEGGIVGIAVYAENVVVDGNAVANATSAGIYVGADDVRVVNNTIRSPAMTGIAVGGPLELLSPDRPRRTTIEGNTVEDAGRAGIELNAEAAVVRGGSIQRSGCVDLAYRPVELNPEVTAEKGWSLVALNADSAMDWQTMCSVRGAGGDGHQPRSAPGSATSLFFALALAAVGLRGRPR